MGIIDGIIVLGILGGLGLIIYGRLRQRNPKFKEVTDKFSLKLIEKVPYLPETPDKMEQVYDEKRAMM